MNSFRKGDFVKLHPHFIETAAEFDPWFKDINTVQLLEDLNGDNYLIRISLNNGRKVNPFAAHKSLIFPLHGHPLTRAFE